MKKINSQSYTFNSQNHFNKERSYDNVSDEDDDDNMSDEEFQEFQEYLQGWLDSIEDKKERNRIKQLTSKLIDVEDVITEFLLMNEETRNSLKDKTDDETNKIRKILRDKRKKGETCYFYKRYGIKYLGDNELFHKMYDWEKKYYNQHHRGKS